MSEGDGSGGGKGEEHKSDEKGFKNRVTRLSEGSGDGQVLLKMSLCPIKHVTNVSNVFQDGDDDSVSVLLEMFPYSCTLEVTHCLRLSAGDVGEAAQLVMHRHDAGQSLKPRSKANVRPPAHKVTDDKAVKSRILDQYSYVDQEDDQKYHRPTLKSAVRWQNRNFLP